ncbi:hypothetical protein M231_07599 [Tremella mesenterica]|uniref:Uncharacterized protein n=1 Tax=Tremella mesenterica TaxID=5217 RepID=A0A4Q1BFJ0_TREME|nr:hypothetical protein M231_07599 [Tremella mesenterica]
MDVGIPEDEKEFATYCSLVLGLTTQLKAARHNTSLLLDSSTCQTNALNNLTVALVDVVNGEGDSGDFFGAMNRAWEASLSAIFPSDSLDLPSAIRRVQTNAVAQSRAEDKGRKG